MPWTLAATVIADVCCIEMIKSKAVNAINISFCFQNAQRVYYATLQVLLPAFITALMKKKKKYGNLLDVTKDVIVEQTNLLHYSF